MQLIGILERFWLSFVEAMPRIVGALIVLGVGWGFGRLLGKGVSSLIRRMRIEESFRKTLLGRALGRSGVSLGLFLDLAVRWLVYIGSLLAAIDILGFKALEPFVTAAVQYLPSLIGGILILVIGLVAVDFAADLSRAASIEARVEYAGIVILGLRFILYFAVVVVALSIMKIDVSILYIFANALAWGAAAGTGVGLGIALGWGLKDLVARNAERWISGARGIAERVGEASEIQLLRERVKELEASIAEHRARMEELVRVRTALMEELTGPVEDVSSKLREIVGEKGKVSSVYGGYHIAVLEPLTFPWGEVMILLTNLGFETWLSKMDERYVIKCKMKEN